MATGTVKWFNESKGLDLSHLTTVAMFCLRISRQSPWTGSER